MNQYELTTEKKKKSIINSAFTLFKEKGFIGVSIKEIAALAKVSQVSIYNYFGSKEALVGECSIIVMQNTLEKAKELISEEMDFKDKLNSALLLCTDEVNNSMNKYFSSEALKDQVMLNLLVEYINKMKIEIYRDYIELGKQEGYINSTISTDIIMYYIEAINNMGAKIIFDETASAKIASIQQLFMYGIIGK